MSGVSALDTRLGREAALKLLNDAISARTFAHAKRFRARSSCSLRAKPSEYLYCSMGLLKGRTLADEIAGKPLRFVRFFGIAMAVLSALSAARSEGIRILVTGRLLLRRGVPGSTHLRLAIGASKLMSLDRRQFSSNPHLHLQERPRSLFHRIPS